LVGTGAEGGGESGRENGGKVVGVARFESREPGKGFEQAGATVEAFGIGEGQGPKENLGAGFIGSALLGSAGANVAGAGFKLGRIFEGVGGPGHLSGPCAGLRSAGEIGCGLVFVQNRE